MAIRKSSSSGIPFGNTASRPVNPQVGQPYFNGQESRLELYTSNVGWQNIVQETPAVISVVGQLNETTSSTIQVNGNNFAVGATVSVIGQDGIEVVSNTTTFISVVELSATLPALSVSNAPYDVKVANPSNLSGILYDSLTVNDQPIWSTSAGSLGTFTELQAISVSVAATDTSDSTNSPLSYSVVSGALPGGLTLNSSTGVISGTASNVVPNTTYSFTIAATDGRNTAVTRAFSITINDRGPSWSTATTLATFTRNVSYSATVSATDDDSISSYTIQSGSLPTGLSLNSSTGVISGTPTSSTNASFTIRATDAGGNFVDRTFTMPNAGPTWVTSSIPSAKNTGASYSTTLVATDDSTISPTITLISGSLPAGFSYNSGTKTISGSTTSTSSTSLTFRATDENGSYVDRTFTLVVTVPTGSYFIKSSSTVTISDGGRFKALVVGSGGGGGGGHANGGGSGRGQIHDLGTLASGASLVATIGSVGVGGSGSGNGSNGGSSSIVVNGNTYSASGGDGGQMNASGSGSGMSGGGGAGNAGSGGAGGSNGSNGSSGATYSGGNGMGTTEFTNLRNAISYPGTNYSITGSGGGSASGGSHAGGGGGGGWSVSGQSPTSSAQGGQALGSGPGGGFAGGGGAGGYDGNYRNGGNGGSGFIYVWEY